MKRLREEADRAKAYVPAPLPPLTVVQLAPNVRKKAKQTGPLDAFEQLVQRHNRAQERRQAEQALLTLRLNRSAQRQQQRFGSPEQQLLRQQQARQNRKEQALREEEAPVVQRPVFCMLQDMIRQNSPLIVITSAVAEAEANYENTVHRKLIAQQQQQLQQVSDKTTSEDEQEKEETEDEEEESNDGEEEKRRRNSNSSSRRTPWTRRPEYRPSLSTYEHIEPRVRLWPYQEEGVQFLVDRETDRANVGSRGGMLCDEMGLGKTLMTLTFIHRDIKARYMKTGRRFNGVSLIVVPKIVGTTWTAEIESKFPANTFRYMRMMGDRASPQHQDAVYIEGCVDIIFTTYDIVKLVYKSLSRERKGQESGVAVDESDDEEESSGDDEEDDTGGEQVMVDAEEKKRRRRAEEDDLKHRYKVLYDIVFLRVIGDEAHRIVNQSTRSFAAMHALRARAKLMITGTPIQNSYANIFACLDFIDVPFTRFAVPSGVSGETLVNDTHTPGLRQLIDRVMLRRLKQNIIVESDNPADAAAAAAATTGGEATSRPYLHKVDKKIEFIDFETQQERILYLLYAEYGQRMVEQRGSVTKKRRSPPSTTTTEPVLAPEEKKMNVTSVIRLMRHCCIDFRIIRRHLLPNGMLSGVVQQQQQQGDSIVVNETTFNEKLFRCDAMHHEHIDPRNNPTLERRAFEMYHHTTFHYRSSQNEEGVTRARQYEWDPYNNRRHTCIDLEHDAFSQALYQQVYAFICETRAQQRRDPSLAEVSERVKQCIGVTDEDEEEDELLQSQIGAVYEHLMARLLPLYGTKFRRILRYIQEERDDASDKVIVFSDSVCFLQLVAAHLAEHRIQSCLVTGRNTRCGENEAQLRRFAQDPEITVLLLSLKMGNVGLNITCANHILFATKWWNPYADLQAECRAQRLGQTKQVHIRYFILCDTMEEYVLSLAKHKEDISWQLIENHSTCHRDETALCSDRAVQTRLFDFHIARCLGA